MDKDSKLTPHVRKLFQKMEKICHDVAWNRLQKTDELFELTASADYPEEISRLAESFGMMLVKVEAREFRMEELLQELKKANNELWKSRQRLLRENTDLKKDLGEKFSSKSIIAKSPDMKAVLDQLERIADTSVNVLITGETGTGKELIAKALHYNSSRRSGPFKAINCSAIPESLLESELFGIEKGVATGVSKRRGIVEQASGGTLLLDEVGDMPLTAQAKILRLLEEREFTRVGGSQPVQVDIRFVAATNKDLEEEIQNKTFRSDLYFRLNVVRLNLPPLRERKIDIPVLARRFLDIHTRTMNRPSMKLSEGIITVLKNYPWPGNIRELENEMERLAALSYSRDIRMEDLSPHILSHQNYWGTAVSADEHPTGKDGPEKGCSAEENEESFLNMAEQEKNIIAKALEAAGYNKTQAARILGISREGLRKKIRKYFPES